MKSRLFLLLSLVALGAALPACTRSQAGEAAPDHDHAPEAAIYKAGFGVQFSPAAAQLAGLATGDVEARALADGRTATVIPAAALLRTVKGDFVYVANGDWFLRTPVKIGASVGLWVEVSDGLYEGDRIVTGGTRALWLAELSAVNGGVGCADGH